MIAGQQYSINITTENTGSTTWTKADNYKLGAQHSPANLWNSGRVYLSDEDSISPNDQKTFTFTVTAPSTHGNYNFQWKMVEEYVQWFGDSTPNFVVNVSSPQDSKHTVSTILFSIYYPGGLSRWLGTGWTPVEGWTSDYDSRDSEWTKNEIKDMMSANIDIVFHSMEPFAGDPNLTCWVTEGYNNATFEGMQNFFETYKDMVEEGYDPPKISEWVNLVIKGGHYSCTYGEQLNISAPEGEDYFYETFIEPFWSNYFSIMDSYADDYLAKRDGKIMISFDYFGNESQDIVGLSNTFFNNIKSRFYSQFGYEVYLLAHPFNDDYPAVDETHMAFGPTNYFWQGGNDSEGAPIIEVLPGFWTIGNPEHLFVSRNESKGYVSAWQQAISLKDQVNRLGITSWNYYGEGSQICESNTTPNSNAKYSHPSEVWGGDFRHYINLTGVYASQWNDVSGNDAQFIGQNIPTTTMTAGQYYPVNVAFRNIGDNKWSDAEGYQLVLVDPIPENQRETSLVDTEDEIPEYGGIFRGRSKTFEISIKAPSTPGSYTLQWRMIQQGVEWFGDYTDSVEVTVV